MRTTAALTLLALALTSRSATAAHEPTPLRPVRYELALRVDFENERLSGLALIRLRNGSGAPVSEASLLLYRLLSVSSVADGAGRAVRFSQDIVAFEDNPKRQANRVTATLDPPLPPGGEVSLSVEYGGWLAGYVETGSLYIKDRIDPDFTIIRMDADAYPTVGVPSFRANRTAGLPTFDYLVRVTVPDTHVVANGGTLAERRASNGLVTYVYRNLKPAWRMDFAIARYGLVERPGLRIFHLPDDAEGAERVARAAEAAIGEYRRWFGPLRVDANFTIIEIPDGWGSQADVTSILQSAAAFRDPEKVEELYHEISHLWNVPSLDRPYGRWNEGLATFLQDLTRERLDGVKTVDDSAERIAGWLRDRGQKEPRLATVPMLDYGRHELTGYAYRVGMLMFYALHRALGDERFGALIGGFYESYHARGATSDEFVAVAERIAGPGVRAIFDDWLYTTRWWELVRSEAPVRDVVGRYGRLASR